jgi:hypothetical protein
MSYNYITQFSSPNFTPKAETRATWGVDRQIRDIVIHWWGDPSQNPQFDGIINTLCNPANQRSAHYVATGTSRQVACLVSPEDNAWATVQENPYSIAIECDPRCRDEDYDVVAELIADIRSAYGDLPLKPHHDFFATACPGNWDLGRLDTISRTKVSHDQWGQVTTAVPPATVTPATVASATPVEKQPQKGAANPYVRFASPMNLVANKQPTNVYDTSRTTWDELNSAVVKRLNQNDPFVAVGKYTHPLGSVYFMTDYSFGQADTTGASAHPYGINTVDLSPAPTPQPVSTPAETTVATPATDGTVNVPVTVVPSDPNKKWQDTFVTYGNGDYIATQSAVVKDMLGINPDLQLIRGQTVKIAGEFIKDGITYYRTQHNVDTGKWYGIPVKANGYDTLTEDDNIFDEFIRQEQEVIAKEVAGAKDMAIKVVASIDGILHRPFNHKK